MGALDNILGNVQQAVITVYDSRPVEAAERKEAEDIKNKKPVSPGTNTGGKAKSNFNMKVNSSTLSGSMKGDVFEWHTSKKRILVQFNPEFISIDGSGGGEAQISNFGSADKDGKKSGLEYAKMDTRITVTIPLIFDAESNARAFIQDKLTLSPTALAKLAASAIMAGKYDFSVRTQTEGLIAILRNEKTREVEFAWSNMHYSGVLQSVQAKYTMFEPSGEPIRSVVTLRIVCADPSLGQGYLGQWKDMYEKAFEGDSTSLTKLGQKAGSILNLG